MTGRAGLSLNLRAMMSDIMSSGTLKILRVLIFSSADGTL